MSVLTVWANRPDGEGLINKLMLDWDNISTGKSDTLNAICSRELFVKQIGIRYNALGSFVSILFENELSNDELALLSAKIKEY
jgi:hypothetical protein